MSIEIDELLRILEKSVEKHGEKPMTNLWLLRCLKMTKRHIEYENHSEDVFSIDLSD